MPLAIIELCVISCSPTVVNREGRVSRKRTTNGSAVRPPPDRSGLRPGTWLALRLATDRAIRRLSIRRAHTLPHLSAPNLVTLAVGFIVILCVVLVLRRLLMRASPASIREDL